MFVLGSVVVRVKGGVLRYPAGFPDLGSWTQLVRTGEESSLSPASRGWRWRNIEAGFGAKGPDIEPDG